MATFSNGRMVLEISGRSVSSRQGFDTKTSVFKKRLLESLTAGDAPIGGTVTSAAAGNVATLTLSTGHDLSTVSAGTATAIPNVALRSYGLCAKPDGTSIVIGDCDATPITLRQYSLSTAWDATTISADGSLDISSQYNSLNPMDVTFGDDGSKLYVCDASSNLHEYDLSTAYDITTATFNQTNSTTFSAKGRLEGVDISPDGTKMAVQSSTELELLYVELSTAFDISTASISGTYDYSVDTTAGATGLKFADGGNLVYFGVGFPSDELIQYTLS